MGKIRIVRSIVLDATALTEAAQEGAQLRIQLGRAIKRGATLHTTAATLTEVLRGHPRDALIHRLLQSLKVRVIDEDLGRTAGERIGRTKVRGNATLDALVAEVASQLPRPVAVLTADYDDITALADPDVMVLDIAA
ncbi:MAG TPA: PIN domain-containing protein [Candidatus Nanopelagicales bacterium]|nr:PIN domain-containing protein [Candidatus Nanopelagicales bacterium]